MFAILNMFDVAVEKRHRGLEDVNYNLYDIKETVTIFLSLKWKLYWDYKGRMILR